MVLNMQIRLQASLHGFEGALNPQTRVSELSSLRPASSTNNEPTHPDFGCLLTRPCSDSKAPTNNAPSVSGVDGDDNTETEEQERV
jgi:hypothetical protein